MSALHNREMGDFPISIGTSEALKGLIDHSLKDDKQNPIKSDWLVNLRTLLRNLIDSVPTEDQPKLHEFDVAKELVKEIGEFIELVRSQTPHITLRIYFPTYASMMRTYPHGSHKIAKTDKQKAYEKMEKQVYAHAMGRLDKHYEKTDCRLPPITANAYITTHFPADLLTKNGFGELILVESHTGTFKRKDQWSSKLTGSDRPEVTALPFNKLTLQVFGDQATQFYSSPPKMKAMLLEMASKGKWNTLTPDERVRFSVGQLYDPFAKRFFGDMLR